MTPDEFRSAGRKVVDEIAAFYENLDGRAIGPAPPSQRRLLDGSLHDEGFASNEVLDAATTVALEHLFTTAHPRHWAFITGSSSPYGVLGSLLMSAVNTNAVRPVGLYADIENRVLAWLGEFLGYPVGGGILVSGGTEANIIGLACARSDRLGPSARLEGMRTAEAARLRIYAARTVHPWIIKACTLLGFGTSAVHWIDDDASGAISPAALRARITADRAAGLTPFFVVGTAGLVTTGKVEPLPELAQICAENEIWFHVDGSYGAPAIACEGTPSELAGLRSADSLALDPHKWFYVPLDAGCALVKKPGALFEAFRLDAEFFSSDPHHAGTPHWNELGIEGSRPFRALKLWLCLLRAGRQGYTQMIAEDIRLAEYLNELVQGAPDLEPFTQHLSITTFRYLPPDLRDKRAEEREYLNRLNGEVINTLRARSTALCSHLERASVLWLRACFVNFRTTPADVEAFVEIVRSVGAEVDARLRARG